MKKLLLWGMGNCFRKYIYAIKYYEMLNKIKIIGVTSNTSIYEEFYGYKYIRKNTINSEEFDFIIVMADGDICKQILNEAISLGIAKENIINYKVLSIPGFDFDKYVKLKKKKPSILANNCWGGITYHSLDLEFTSPFINMFESTVDYLKLLKNIKKYMNEELELISTVYEKKLDIYYPVVKCGDITLHFNHYHSFEEAKLCWERRKRRINWDNLFVMMYTEDSNLANEFIKLPYDRKVCFVPFYSDEQELIQIDFRNKGDMVKVPFGEIVNGMAWGEYPYYDIFDLLGEGKFTRIEKFRT